MITPVPPPLAHPPFDAIWGPVVARLLAEGGTIEPDEDGGWELDCSFPNAECFHLFEGVHDQLVWSDDDSRRTAQLDGAGNDIDDEMTCSLRLARAARIAVVSSTHWQAGTSYRLFAAATDEGFERAVSRARAVIAEACRTEEDEAFAEQCAAYDAYCDEREAAEKAAAAVPEREEGR